MGPRSLIKASVAALVLAVLCAWLAEETFARSVAPVASASTSLRCAVRVVPLGPLSLLTAIVTAAIRRASPAKVLAACRSVCLPDETSALLMSAVTCLTVLFSGTNARLGGAAAAAAGRRSDGEQPRTHEHHQLTPSHRHGPLSDETPALNIQALSCPRGRSSLRLSPCARSLRLLLFARPARHDVLPDLHERARPGVRRHRRRDRSGSRRSRDCSPPTPRASSSRREATPEVAELARGGLARAGTGAASSRAISRARCSCSLRPRTPT